MTFRTSRKHPENARSHGAVGFQAGLAAENIVLRFYSETGYRHLRSRWRGGAGEIDLILEKDDTVVFVEVKKSRTFAAAALRVSPRQAQRICLASEEFLGQSDFGLLYERRFDVALVDEIGQVRVIENAFAGII